MAYQTSGRFGWVDVGVPDATVGKRFYEGLFGWKGEDMPIPGDAGTYTMFSMDGKVVAALGPNQGGMPPAWRSYVIVDDADVLAARAKEFGGKVLMEPQDILDTGRIAMLADPTGSVLGLWQPGTHKGAEVIGEPGSVAWNELVTKGLEEAKAFYEKLFGWKWEQFGETDAPYFLAKADGQSAAGAMEMGPDWPEGVPSHWDVYFEVDDADAAAERVKKLGGKVLSDPIEAPGVGRFYMVSDPAGAMFYLMKSASQQ